MKMGKTASVLGFVMLGAACTPAKGTLKTADHQTVRKRFVPMEEAHSVKAAWEKGKCALEDENTISYTLRDKSRKVINLSMEVYSGSEEPLGIRCSDNNTTVLTDRKVGILPGLDSFEGSDEAEFDMMLSHSLEGIADRGISSWNIQSGDYVFLITGDNRFWYLDLKSNDDMLGFALGELHEGTKEMFYYRKLLFIAQNSDAGEEFLLAVRPLKAEESIALRSFSNVAEVSGQIAFSEKDDHLQLKVGSGTHKITVEKEGKSDSVLVD